MHNYEHNFTRKVLLAILLGGALIALGYLTVPADPTSSAQTDPDIQKVSADQPVRGEVLGATTEAIPQTDALRSGPESKVCPFKIFTDSFPRGEVTMQDSLCGQ